jgi:hypothetical protein
MPSAAIKLPFVDVPVAALRPLAAAAFGEETAAPSAAIKLPFVLVEFALVEFVLVEFVLVEFVLVELVAVELALVESVLSTELAASTESASCPPLVSAELSHVADALASSAAGAAEAGAERPTDIPPSRANAPTVVVTLRTFIKVLPRLWTTWHYSK